MLRRILPAIALAAALLAGCATPEEGDVTTTVTQPAPTTVTPPATTTPEAAAASPGTVQQVPVATSEQAVRDLLAAWRAGDREAALRVARPPAVEALFARPPASTQARGCDSARETVDCAYRLGENLLTIRMARAGEGWVVEEVEIQ